MFYLATLPKAKASAQPCERKWAWGWDGTTSETGCTEQRLGSLSPQEWKPLGKQGFQSPGPFTKSPQAKMGQGVACSSEELLTRAEKVASGMMGAEVGQRCPGVLRYRCLVVHCVVWASRSQPGALQPWQLAH